MSLVSYDSMTADLTITEFRAICETLGRFADVRETAKEPRDRIVVQGGKDGKLKLIAGTDDYTVVADLGLTSYRGKAVVKSRLLLQAAKSLRGRGTVDFESADSGVLVKVSTGAKLSLSSISSRLPELVRPPKKSEALYHVDHPGFDLASKLFPAATSKFHPSDKVYLTAGHGDLSLTGCDQRTYVRWELDMGYVDERWQLGSLPADLFPALRDLTEPGVLAWGDGRLAIRSGRFLVGSRIGGDVDPFTKMPEPSTSTTVYVDRKQLIDALRSMAGNDENRRSRLVTTGTTGLELRHWEGEGSLSLEVEASGPGETAVDAERMRKLLAGLPGRTVSIQFDGTRPGPILITTEEARDWLTLLAPVV